MIRSFMKYLKLSDYKGTIYDELKKFGTSGKIGIFTVSRKSF
jgi:hypothetical protein